MINKKSNMGDLLNIKKSDIKVNSKLDQWLVELLDKCYLELTIKDINTMIRQNILLDIAITKSIEFLRDDPLTGELYDGQLIKVISDCILDIDEDVLQEFSKVIKDIDNNINKDDFDEEDYYYQYVSLINILKDKSLKRSWYNSSK